MLKKILLIVIIATLLFTNVSLAQVNNCLSFDGVDDYVSLDLNGNLGARTTFTIEMWTNISSIASSGYSLFENRVDTLNNIKIITNPDGSIQLSVCNANSGIANAPAGTFLLNTWFHIAVVFDGTLTGNANRLKLYINGKQITLSFPSNAIPSVTPTLSGNAILGSAFITCKTDELRIWHTSARTEAQINTTITSTLGTSTGLLASYHFDEGTAGGDNAGVTVLNDRSGATNHSGVLTNFALTGNSSNWISRVYPGSNNNCLQFDGTDDFVNLSGLSGEIDNKSALTISMWVNIDNWAEDKTLFSKYYNIWSRTQIQEYTEGNLQITIEQGGTDDGNDSRAYTTTSPVATGQWFHLAMVFDGTQSGNTNRLKLYINGQPVTLTYRGTINADLNSTVYPALIGAQGAGLSDVIGNYFSGKIDEACIWNIARSQAEVQLNMTTPPAGSEAGLVSYFSFNQGIAASDNSLVTVLNDLSIESDWNSGSAAKNFGVLNNFALTGSASNFLAILAGSGTELDPYLITSIDDLSWISQNTTLWASFFKQTANIDASATSSWNSDGSGGYYGWSPIGSSVNNFTGSYDGNAHTISGLYINRGTSDYQGFFGNTNSTKIIRKLGLVNVNVTGRNYVGGFAGLSGNDTTTECFVTGQITSTGDIVGGFVGYNNNNSSTNNCYSTATVTAHATQSDYVGGFCGYNNTWLISCYSTGLVTGGVTYVGGFLGYAGNNQNCFWDTETSGQSTSWGGALVVGRTSAIMKTINNFTAVGWDFKIEKSNGTNEIWNTGNGRNNGYPYFNWQYPADALPAPTGSGTAGAPYLISTLDHLYWISVHSTSWNKYFTQTADIDASTTNIWNSGAGWSPIGNVKDPFSGNYNGGGFTISGIFINRQTEDHQSFLGCLNHSSVQNLGLLSVNIKGRSYVGGFVGSAYNSTFSNCYTTGTVRGYGNNGTGGFIGSTGAVISQCYATASVTAPQYGGGFVGYIIAGNIDKCYSTGLVLGNSNVGMGGFVGYFNGGAISNCYSRGDVSSSNDYVGGFVGYFISGTLSKCYSTGVVFGVGSHVGGFSGIGTGAINSFWDNQTSNKTTSSMGTGKTTAEMKTLSTFTGVAWDFDTIWNIGNLRNEGYPYLQFQYPADPNPLVQDNALSLDGTNDFVSVPASNAFAFGTGDFTVEWLQYQTDTNHYPRIFSLNNNEFSISLELFGVPWKFFLWINNSSYSVTISNYKNTWTHFAVTRTAGILRMYMNGNLLKASDTNATSINNSTSPLIIGKNTLATENFGGKLDELRFWNVARTQTEIQNNMNTTLVGNESGLVAYYNFKYGTAEGSNIGITSLPDASGNGHNGTLYNFTLTGTTSNWVTGYSGTPLPVELFSFNSSLNGRNITLNWETKSEINSENFVVERTDENLIWRSLSTLKAAGLSNSPKEYSFVDKNLQSGKYQYRLKMVNSDGTFEYSKVIDAEVGVPTTLKLEQNYPNPFNPSTKISYSVPADSKIMIEVYSIAGEKICSLVNEEKPAGFYSVDFGTSSGSLASGVYIYRLLTTEKLTGKTTTLTKKMLLMK